LDFKKNVFYYLSTHLYLNIFTFDYNHLKYNDGQCAECAGNVPISYEDILYKVFLNNGKLLTSRRKFYRGIKKNDTHPSKTPFLVLCEELHVFKTTWDLLESHNSWCPHCYGNAPKIFKNIKLLIKKELFIYTRPLNLFI